MKKNMKNAMNNDNCKTNISNCTFHAVKWDVAATNMAQTIADALKVNAEALSKLAEVLKASNVTVDSMIKVVSKEA